MIFNSIFICLLRNMTISVGCVCIPWGRIDAMPLTSDGQRGNNDNVHYTCKNGIPLVQHTL